MILELFALLIGLSFLFLFFADYRTRKPFFTIAAGFILTFLGIMLSISPIVYGIGSVSMVSDYDAYCNVTDLFPEEEFWLADNVSCEDCTNVVGTVANTWAEDGIYYSNEEDGTNYNTTFEIQIGSLQCQEHLHWVGRYDGGLGTGIKYYIYNWTSSNYQALTTNTIDVLKSGTDSEYVVTGCNKDFLNDTTGYVMFKFVGVNVKNGDEMFFDLVYADTESTINYAEDTRIINCTQHEETSLNSNSDLDENFNLLIAIFLIMLGLGTFLYGVINTLGRETEE